jgi:alkanesulfonate monooxygenase SsuD/methylene tetrahydromethanopterin reductase-like flavin-dependent oxidoreductase (luciferase family)
MPLENRHEAFVTLATQADRLGYDGLFLPETWAYDTTVLLAEAAARTERLTLGTGILGVWNRSAATIAMAAATLATVSRGRFVLGLGASTPQLTEGLHDVRFAAPIARVRRTVQQVRALLRGERIPLAVTTEARALKLNLRPAGEVPIYLAALGAQSVRLTGEVADGWMPFIYPRSYLRYGIEELRAGAAAAGHPERVPSVCPSLPAVVSEDPAGAREGAAWFVSFYLTTMGTLYRQSLTRQGFGKEVEAVLAANAPRFAGVVPPDADALLEELVVFGTPAEARRRLARWHDAGAEVPVLLLRPGLSPDEMTFTLRALAPAP